MRPKELEVLRLLVAMGPSRGLELVKASEAQGGALTRGTVYLVLSRMEKALLIEGDPEPNTPAHIGIGRKIYQLTTIGRRVVEREQAGQ